MNKVSWMLAACAVVTVAGAANASEPALGQQITRAGTLEASMGPADRFVGRVRVEPLFAADGNLNASAAYVTFESGARSAWHIHPAGQRLIVVSGTGLTQEWGRPIQQIQTGDVVVCPPGIKHWHGAGPSTAMTHLAITGAVDGKSVDWMEQVSDAEYDTWATANRFAIVSLSRKQQAIPLIGAAMARSDMPALTAALNQGLDAGLAISEAKEVLVQLYAYAGFPRSLNALAVLMQVVEDRKRRGKEDAPGREPTGTIPENDALLAIGKMNQTRISGAPITGPVFEFAPVINEYLQAHLFGSIFERDNLDWQSRELATVGALSATPGTEAQLRSHMAASMRVGLTAQQLQELTVVLSSAGDVDSAKRAREALASHLERTGERR